MNNKQILLEQLKDLESLNVDDFVSIIENFHLLNVSERLDGNPFFVSIDSNNRLYTYIDDKRKVKFYKTTDFPLTYEYNEYRAAHLVMEKNADTIKNNINIGDSIEFQIIYGKQPNNIIYHNNSHNFLIIIKGGFDTVSSRVDAIKEKLNNKEFEVSSKVFKTNDGESVIEKYESSKWKILPMPEINVKRFNLKSIDDLLSKMNTWFKKEAIEKYNNYEILKLNLTKIKAEDREKFSELRKKISKEFLDEFKLPIKTILLNNIVNKITPILHINKIKRQSEDTIDGIIIYDKNTNQRVRVIDNDLFTAINSFNNSYTNMISGLVKTSDSKSTYENKGGIFGEAKLAIASILGNINLAVPVSAKSYFTKLKKDSIHMTLFAIVNDLKLEEKDFESNKGVIVGILEKALENLQKIMETFKNEKDSYSLTLATGDKITMSNETFNKTLNKYAQTNKEIELLSSVIERQRDYEGIINTLYGNTLNKIHYGEQMITEDAEGATTTTDVAGYSTKLTDKMLKRSLGFGKVSKRKRSKKRLMKYILPFYLNSGSNKDSNDKTNDADGSGSSDVVNESIEQNNEPKKSQSIGIYSKKQEEIDALRIKILSSPKNEPINQSLLNKYLEALYEFDSYPACAEYGIELDDSSIYKIYVNILQAEQFEKELPEILYKHKKFEEVIEILIRTFDIVDIVSLEDADKDTDNEDGMQEDETNDDSVNNKDDDNKSKEHFDNVNQVNNDSSDNDDSNSNDEDEDEEKDSTNNSDDEIGKAAFGQAISSISTDIDLNYTENLKKTLRKLLNESDETLVLNNISIKDEIDLVAKKSIQNKTLLNSISDSNEKILFATLLSLNIQTKNIMSNKSKIVSNMRKTLSEIDNKPLLVFWFKKLLLELEKTNYILKESNPQQYENISNVQYSTEIYKLLESIGYSYDIMEKYKSSTLKSIKSISKKISNNNVLKNIINNIVKVLDLNFYLTESIDFEDNDKNSILTEYEINNDHIKEILSIIGIDFEDSRSINQQYKLSKVQNNLRKLYQNSLIQSKLNDVSNLVQKMFNKQIVNINENNEKRNWIISKIFSGFVNMNSKGLIINIQPKDKKRVLESLKNKESFKIESKKGIFHFDYEFNNTWYVYDELDIDKKIEMTNLDYDTLQKYLV